MHGCARIVDNGKFGKGLELSEDGNVTFDVERFHNRPTDAITIALWLNLTQVNGSHELFFTCGTPELYNMGDYHFAIDSGKIRWLEELPGGGTRFNVSSSKRQPFVLNSFMQFYFKLWLELVGFTGRPGADILPLRSRASFVNKRLITRLYKIFIHIS